MTRSTTLALLIALTGTAFAQSQAEIAAKLNDEGKQLMYADRPAEAAKKFQEAVARVPEAKYFINLCTARLQEGKLDEALTACQAVELNNPSADQKSKATKLIEKVREEAKAQGLELHPGGGGGGDPGDPTNPENPNPNDPTHAGDPATAGRTPTVGRPLGQNLVMAGPPDHKYTWTLGADFFGGGGRVGQPDAYGSAVAGLRLKGDYLLDPVSRVGGQVYFQLSHFGQGQDDLRGVDTLDVFDVGVAGYKHVCLGSTPRLCITPLLGAHLSLMSPTAGEMDGTGSQVFNYAGVGARGEVSLAYAFGARFEHVIAAMIGVNVYSRVLSGPSADDPSGSLTIEEAGLDAGGATAYLGLGYTYRFDTPLGNSPFVTLE